MIETVIRERRSNGGGEKTMSHISQFRGSPNTQVSPKKRTTVQKVQLIKILFGVDFCDHETMIRSENQKKKYIAEIELNCGFFVCDELFQRIFVREKK
jgi:hypothetical protein